MYSITRNKKVILEIGWYPFNRNLLPHPELVTSLTKEENFVTREEHLLGTKNELSVNEFPENIPNATPNF